MPVLLTAVLHPRAAQASPSSSDLGFHPGLSSANLSQICARSSISHCRYSLLDIDADVDSAGMSAGVRSGLGTDSCSAMTVLPSLLCSATIVLPSLLCCDRSSSLCELLSSSSREYVTVDAGFSRSGVFDTRGESLDRGVRTILLSGYGISGVDAGSLSGARFRTRSVARCDVRCHRGVCPRPAIPIRSLSTLRLYAVWNRTDSWMSFDRLHGPGFLRSIGVRWPSFLDLHSIVSVGSDSAR